MGSRGQPAAWDTRCRETFPAVSHGKSGVSSQDSELREPEDLLLTGLWPSPGGQPLGARAADLPAAHRAGPSLLLRPSPTAATPGEGQGVLGSCGLWPGSDSRCAQLGPGLPQTRGTGRGRFLPARGGASTAQSSQGSVGGRGLALPSHASPQAGPAAKDELVYSQETRLPASREKVFYTGA